VVDGSAGGHPPLSVVEEEEEPSHIRGMEETNTSSLSVDHHTSHGGKVYGGETIISSSEARTVTEHHQQEGEAGTPSPKRNLASALYHEADSTSHSEPPAVQMFTPVVSGPISPQGSIGSTNSSSSSSRLPPYNATGTPTKLPSPPKVRHIKERWRRGR